MASTTQTPPATLAALAAPVPPHLDGNSRAVFDPQVWMRVCRPGERCPVTGLSRSSVVELCVPGPRNNYRPPVEARRLKRKGAARGILLVSKISLLEYIADQPAPTRADADEGETMSDGVRAAALAELKAASDRVADAAKEGGL